jgi:hypothetical protein
MPRHENHQEIETIPFVARDEVEALFMAQALKGFGEGSLAAGSP